MHTIKGKYLLKILMLFTLSAQLSCVEEITFTTRSYEDLLVIDATLTNEMKRHEIFLSRTFRFSEDLPSPETNAIVGIREGNSFIGFQEIEQGKYVSITEFKPEPDVDYQLEIVLANGMSYHSETTRLTPRAQIENIYVERTTEGGRGEGASVFVDSYDPSGAAKFFRYSFEETYKIIVPNFRSKDLIVVSDVWPDCEVALVPRPESVGTCYQTEPGDVITTANSNNLNSGRVQRHQVNFLSIENTKITHRYSLLAVQYTQTQEANTYYRGLLSFVENGSLFSQVQSGYLQGNINSQTNPDEKVVGYFEVVSVAKKRVFFNYRDLFPDAPLPPYFIDCFESAQNIFGPPGSERCGSLISLLQQGALAYLDENNGQIPDGGPHLMVPKICGDCSDRGETEPPEFWTE